MKLKVTLVRAGQDQGTDLLVETDPSVPTARIAAAIAERDPLGTTGVGLAERTIRVEGVDGTRVVAPDMAIGDAPIRSGDRISVIDGAGRYVEAGDERAAAATLLVVEGPDRDTRFHLRPGSSQVGRQRGSDVHLADPMVSKRHARLNVTDVIEVIDLASANGILVDGEHTARSILRPGDHITLGETTLLVEHHSQPAASVVGSTVAFNRSPHLDPRYEGH